MLAAILIIGGGIAAFRLGVVERNAREYLIRRVSAELGADFEISAISFSPWAVGFSDVRLRMKDIPLTVEAKRIRIGFNLASLIRHRFRPVYGTERLFLDHPRFIWRLGEPGDSSRSFDMDEIPPLPIAKIPRVFISVNSGSFAVARDTTIVDISRDVSGWLDGRTGPAIEVKLEAKLLSARKNVTCDGLLHRGRESARFDIRAESCDFSGKPARAIFQNVTVKSGKLDFALHGRQLGGVLSWNGNYQVRDCTIHPGESKFGVDSLSVAGRILRHEVTLDTVSGSIVGIRPRVKGRLTLDGKARLELTAEAGSIDLSRLFARMAPRAKELPRGDARASVGIHGYLDSLSVNAAFTAPLVEYRGQTFQNAALRMKAGRDGIVIEQAEMTVAGYAVTAAGTLAGKHADRARPISAAVSARPQGTDGGEYRCTLAGNADSRLTSLALDAVFLNTTRASFVPGKVTGKFSLRKDTLNFSIESDGIRATGTAAQAFSKPRLDARVLLSRFPVLKYAGAGNSSLLLDGSIDMRGVPAEMELITNMRLSGPRNLTASVTGRAKTSALFDDARAITAELTVEGLRALKSPPNTFTVFLHSGSTETTVTINDLRHGAAMSLRTAHDTGALTGALHLRGYPLENIIAFFVSDTREYAGRLTGDAVLAGTVDNPRFFTSQPIQAEEMTLGAFTRLSGTLGVSGEKGRLRFSDVDLRRDGKPILGGDGIWSSGNPFVFAAKGRGVEFGAIGDIITKDRKCDGLVDYDATLSFARSAGTINGAFVIRNGHFMDIPFDEAAATISGGSHGFTVSDFRVGKTGVYSGTGSASSGYIWKDASGGQGLKLSLDLRGNLLPALPRLTPAIKSASGDCILGLTLGGSWQEPVIVDARLAVSGGTVVPSFLDEKVTNISAEMAVDPETKTASGLRAARILSGNGTVNGTPISVKNVFERDPLWDTIKRPGLVNIVNGLVGLDFGVFAARIERGKNRTQTLELYVPGFMKPGMTGQFELTGDRGGWFIVGAAPGDEHLSPYIGGAFRVLSGDITYPLIIEKNAAAENTGILENIYWDMEIFAGSSVYYFNEFSRTIEETRINLPFWKMHLPLAGATLMRTSAKLDEKSTFAALGKISDGSFRVTGDARSTSGTVSYFGVEFDIENIEFEMDTARTLKPVILTARAVTTVTDDSTGVETDIYLKVNAIDRASGNRRQATGRTDVLGGGGTGLASATSKLVDAKDLGYLEIQLVSTNPADNTSEKVFARLGLSAENVGSAATRALAQGMDEYYLNFMRPLERLIRKYTTLDVVRFTPMVIGNLVRSKLVILDRFGQESDYMLFDGSYVMLGEYFMDGFFLSYRGQYGLAKDFLKRKKHGFYHEINLQYPLKRNTLIQFNYDYDNVIRQSDKRIEIRHDFEF